MQKPSHCRCSGVRTVSQAELAIAEVDAIILLLIAGPGVSVALVQERLDQGRHAGLLNRR